MKRLIFILFLSSSLIKCKAQDIHWSQTNENPIYQNPANCGLIAENADFRITVSSKDQWRNVTKPYQTQYIAFDTKYKYFQKLAYGLQILNDVTGDGAFRTLEIKITPAYTFFEKKKSKVRVGLDFSWKYNQMNFSNYMFDNQFNGLMYTNTLPSNEKNITQQKSVFSLGMGFLYSTDITENLSMKFGSAIFNLNQPDEGFYGVVIPRFRRYHHFIQTSFKISSKLNILPSLNFQHQGTYNELIFGSKSEYKLNSVISKNTLIAGLYFRNNDAIFPQLGIKINKIVSTISYDINVSKLAKASNGRGGLEINIQYIWYRELPKKITHKKCYDYI